MDSNENMKAYLAVFSGGYASAVFLVYAPSRSSAYMQLLEKSEVQDFLDNFGMSLKIQEVVPSDKEEVQEIVTYIE
jgi:hypothetical protein